LGDDEVIVREVGVHIPREIVFLVVLLNEHLLREKKILDRENVGFLEGDNGV
jgi:hypothetical protein